MNLKINNLYGIKNKIEFKGADNKNMIIFAPNGVGKSSIKKGFTNIAQGESHPNMEGELPSAKSLVLEIENKKSLHFISNKKNQEIFVIDSNSLQNAFNMEDGFLNSINDIYKLPSKNSISKKIIEVLQKFRVEETIAEDFFDGIYPLEQCIQSAKRIFEQYNDKDDIELEILDINNKIKVMEELEKSIQKYINANPNNIKKKSNQFKDVVLSNRKIGKVSNDHILDKTILESIINKKRDEYFQYLKNKEEATGVKEALKILREEIANKYSDEDVDMIVSLTKVWNNLSSALQDKINHGSTTFNSLQTNHIRNKKAKLYFQKNCLNIKKNQDKIEVAIKNYNTESQIFVEKSNQTISEINNLFESGILEWKIKINKKISLFDDSKIYFLKDSEEQDYDDFYDYASEGEKCILYLIASMIIAGGSNTLIFDDVLSSMDNHHINEFATVLTNKLFEQKNKIILTHNFTLFRDFSFNRFIYESSSFHIFDKKPMTNKKEMQTFVQDIQHSELSNLMNISYVYKTDNIIKKILVSSNIIRELISNNLLSDSVPVLGLNPEQNKLFNDAVKINDSKAFYLKILTFIDANIRHFKKNITNKMMKERMKELISGVDLSFVPPIILEFIKLIDGLPNKEKSILKEILDFDHKQNRFKNLTEYVNYKVILGTKIRFTVEDYVHYNGKNVNKKWESMDEWNLASPENKKLFSFESNYLVHVNSVQWTKVIEMPIYKIVKLLEKKKNEAKKIWG